MDPVLRRGDGGVFKSLENKALPQTNQHPEIINQNNPRAIPYTL